MLGLQPGLQGSRQVLPWTQALHELFGCIFDPAEEVRTTLQPIPDFVDRQMGCRNRSLMPLLRQNVGQIRQAGRLFPICPVKLHHSKRGIGSSLRDFEDFLITRNFARQERIGKHFAQLGCGAVALSLQQVEIDLVDRGQLDEQLHRERALVPLDQVQIGRRYPKRLRHCRLRQAEPETNTSYARPCENLAFSHLSPFLHARTRQLL